MKAGDVTITPWVGSLIVRWPGGGFVWNRPVMLVVAHNGQTRRLPIVDVTRRIELALLALPTIIALIMRNIQSRQRRTHDAK
jgi:hypothetical protein